MQVQSVTSAELEREIADNLSLQASLQADLRSLRLRLAVQERRVMVLITSKSAKLPLSSFGSLLKIDPDNHDRWYGWWGDLGEWWVNKSEASLLINWGGQTGIGGVSLDDVLGAGWTNGRE